MPDAVPSPASRPVFLSYSREDAESARRIADAIRAFGIEVWFDQNELRGGDSWDAKIKRQIRECSLFLPIISSHTQVRMEGYFRREWKLGVERTHDMAGGVAFITPVVIDDTPESAALVAEANDAVDGPVRSATRAKILAWTGDTDSALAEFARLLRTPYGVQFNSDRFDTGWIPLRNDPRFQVLLADPKNNEPLF